MMRITYSLILALVLSWANAARAQSWFTPGQQAYEITTPNEGVYALAAGQSQRLAPLQGSPVGQLKVFRNGREVAIWVQDADNSGTWTVGDSLFFYATRNRGELEQGLYQRTSFMNPWSPLYGLAGRYFLMVSPGAGRRMALTRNALPDSPTQTEWTAEATLAPRNEYSPGLGAYQDAKFHQSFVGDGEGYCSQGSFLRSTFSITHPYTLRTGNAKMILWLAGRTASMQRAIVSIGNTQVMTTTWESYRRKIDSTTVPASTLGQTITFSTLPSAANSFISLMLARFVLPVQATVVNRPQAPYLAYRPAIGRLRLPALGGSGFFVQVNDPYSPKRLSMAGGNYVAEPDSAGNGLTAIWLQARPFSITDSIVTERQLSAPPTIQSGQVLVITAKRLFDTAQAYVAYRRSPQGGSHNIAMVQVEDLYAHYTYGYPSAEALRLYLKDLITTGRRPSTVFLLGQGIQHNFFRLDNQMGDNLVPCWGMPASDNMLVSTDTGQFYNKIPIARLAVYWGYELLDYLDKVKVQEANNQADWRKKAIHLSGGRTAGEIEEFRQHIQSYSGIFQNPVMGGRVYEYSKQSASIIETVNIRDQINAGAVIMTLFGHSAANATDIDIGIPQDPAQGYDNLGKAPFILVNGCFSGNIFNFSVRSLNQHWVLARGKGAIAFAGSMDEGLPPLLNRHSTLLYQYQFKDSTTNWRSLAEVFQYTNRAYMEGAAGRPSVFDSIMVSQMVIHGDPLLRLFPFRKPDFAFDAVASRLVDQDVSTFTKSFDLKLKLQNLGQYRLQDSVSLIGRIESGGGVVVYGPSLRFPAIKADSLIDYRISGGFELDNSSTLIFSLDYLNRVAEQSEQNNDLVVSLGRFESGIRFVYPTRDAIVSTRALRLTYRSLNQNVRGRVELWLDTVRTFDSPLLQQHAGPAQTLAELPVVLPAVPDSTVFFLRSRYVDDAGASPWRAFNFTLMQGRDGWSQSIGYQFFTNQKEGYTVDSTRNRRPWLLPERRATVRLYTVGAGLQRSTTNTGIDINGIPYYYGNESNCFFGSRVMTLRLNRDFVPRVFEYQQPVGEYWRYACGRVPPAINFFEADWMRLDVGNPGALPAFAIAQMQPGEYFFAITQGQHNYLSWRGSRNAQGLHLGAFYNASTFVGQDTAKIRRTIAGAPLMFYGLRTERSLPGLGITIGPNTRDTINDRREAIDTTFVLRRFPQNGRVESPFVGPALSFQALAVATSRNLGRADSAVFTLRAFRSFADTGDIIYRGRPLSQGLRLDSSQYRFVKLYYEAPNRGDSTTYLQFWRVFFRPFPEGVAIAAAAPATVEAGDSIVVKAKYHHTLGIVGNPLAAKMYVRSAAGILLDSLAGLARLAQGTDTSYVQFKWKSQLDSPDDISFEITFNTDRLPERDFGNNSIFAATRLLKDTGLYAGYFEIDGLFPEEGLKTGASPQIKYILNRPFGRRSLTMLFGSACDTCSLSQITDFSVAGAEATYQPQGLRPGIYEVQATVQDRFRRLVPLRKARFEVMRQDSLWRFTAAPNPASQYVTFAYQSAGANQGGKADLVVLNAFGQQVFSQTVSHTGLLAGTMQWNLAAGGAALEAGVYMARLRISTHASTNNAEKSLTGAIRLVILR